MPGNREEHQSAGEVLNTILNVKDSTNISQTKNIKILFEKAIYPYGKCLLLSYEKEVPMVTMIKNLIPDNQMRVNFRDPVNDAKFLVIDFQMKQKYVLGLNKVNVNYKDSKKSFNVKYR